MRDYRTGTLRALDKFLTILEQRYSSLLYLHDEDLRQLVATGNYDTDFHGISVGVMKRKLRGKNKTGLAR